MFRRIIVIDFETNGLAERKATSNYYTLPWQNYPCQLSVDIVEDGETWHAFDTLIRGATRFGRWSANNLSFTVEEANEKGVELAEAIDRLAALITPGATIVAHNISFDMDQCLARTAKKLGYDSVGLQRVLTAPRFCTYRCEYSKLLFGNKASLEALCKHFEVDYCKEKAHDASYDTCVLAACVAAALRRGVMWKEQGWMEQWWKEQGWKGGRVKEQRDDRVKGEG